MLGSGKGPNYGITIAETSHMVDDPHLRWPPNGYSGTRVIGVIQIMTLLTPKPQKVDLRLQDLPTNTYSHTTPYMSPYIPPTTILGSSPPVEGISSHLLTPAHHFTILNQNFMVSFSNLWFPFSIGCSFVFLIW